MPIRVVVAGDAMLDLLIEGRPTRLSPDAAWAPVVLADAPRLRAGGAAFLATALSGVDNVSVHLLCPIADDWAGELLTTLLVSRGIRLLKMACSLTTLKVSTVSISEGRYHPICRGDVDAGRVEDPLRAAAGFLDVVDGADAVICADYNKGLFVSGDLAQALRERAGLSVADPKPANISRFAGFDVLTPNLSEALSALDANLDELGSPSGVAAELEVRIPCGLAAVTCNGTGVACRDSQWSSAGQWSCPVRSTAGAGDVFTAMLAVGLLRGDSEMSAVQTAEYLSRRYAHTGLLPHEQ